MEGTIKPITNYDGYFVDDYGNVYCNLGKGNRRNGKTVELYKLKLKTLKSGYVQVRMRNSSSNKVHYPYVHRLVAMAFIDNPFNKPCINHINCIRNDNRVSNLEWVTQKENTKHTEMMQHIVRNSKGQYESNFKYMVQSTPK